MSKRIIVIFSILLGLVLIVVLASTLFNLNTVEVKFTQNISSDVTESKIQDVMKKYERKNLLFLSEKDVIKSVRATSSYIDSVVVEKVFPTTVRLHITQRSEIFAIKLEEKPGVQKYYILDINGYILRTSDDLADNTTQLQKNILIEGVLENEVVSKNVGERIILKDIAKLNCISQIFSTMQSLEDPYSYTVQEMKVFISRINVLDIRSIKMTTYPGVRIEINDGESNMVNKIRMMIGTYNALKEIERTKGTIRVYSTQSNELGCDATWSKDE